MYLVTNARASIKTRINLYREKSSSCFLFLSTNGRCYFDNVLVEIK